MDLSYLKKVVRIVESSSVDEIEVEEEGLRIRVSKNSHHGDATVHQHSSQRVDAQAGQPVPVAPPPMSAEVPPAVTYHEIKSPIVGTFYRAPAPDADSYVEVGQIVQPKQVLCIIEAMKLMNEIESDFAGRIVKILVENGQAVEYNQLLFLIEPT